jgi:hypothetical protein
MTPQRAFHRIPGLVVALLLACGTSVGRAQAPAPAQADVDTVTTSGEGVIKVAPDRAFVTLSAEARAKSPREAQRQAADAMTAVQQRLRSLDLAHDAIRTVSYDVQPEFDFANGKQSLRGYVARNAIEVRVDDIARVGDVLDAAVAAGATSVRDVRFDLKARETVEHDALKRAVGEARARAEAMAAAAGRTLDRIVRLEEQGASFSPPPFPMAAMRAEAAAAPAPVPPVVAGDIEVRARVTLTARLK